MGDGIRVDQGGVFFKRFGSATAPAKRALVGELVGTRFLEAFERGFVPFGGLVVLVFFSSGVLASRTACWRVGRVLARF